MTGIKAREEVVLELGDKILKAVQEVSENQTESLSLLEVIIACGNAQIAIYDRGYAKKTAKIETYEKNGLWYASETSIGAVRDGKTREEALTALENALLAYPSYVLKEAQMKAIPDAVVAIREAKKESR